MGIFNTIRLKAAALFFSVTSVSQYLTPLDTTPLGNFSNALGFNDRGIHTMKFCPYRRASGLMGQVKQRSSIS